MFRKKKNKKEQQLIEQERKSLPAIHQIKG
jgi:hypothetical protein